MNHVTLLSNSTIQPVRYTDSNVGVVSVIRFLFLYISCIQDILHRLLALIFAVLGLYLSKSHPSNVIKLQ